MNTLSRLALRSCLAMATFCIFSAVAALAQTWIMDAQPDFAVSTQYDCSATAQLVPSPDGGTYILNNPSFVGDIRVERIRRLDIGGKLDRTFNYTAPAGSSVTNITALKDDGLIVSLRLSDSSYQTIRLSRSGSLMSEYAALKGVAVSKLITLASGNVIVSGFSSDTPTASNAVLLSINPSTGQVTKFETPFQAFGSLIYGITPRAQEGFWINGFLYGVSSNGHSGVVWQALHDDGTLDTSFNPALLPVSSRTDGTMATLSDGSAAVITDNSVPGYTRTKLTHVKADGTTDPLFDKLEVNHISKVYHLAPNYLVLEVRDQVSPGHPSIFKQSEFYDNTHSTVLLVSEDGLLLRNLNESLPADWDLNFAGLLGNGGIAVRQGVALRSRFQGWEISYDTITISHPTLAWYTPLGVSTALSQALLETKAGSINQYLPDNQGGLFLSGDFNSINGQARPGVAHLLANGSLDPSFSGGTDSLYNGKVSFLQSDGNLLFLNEELSPTADASGVHRTLHMLRRFTAQGAYDASFKGVEVNDTNRLKVLAHSDKGYLVSFFAPDNLAPTNLRLQWLDNSGTPLGNPGSLSFSGVSFLQNSGFDPATTHTRYENTLAYSFSLPNGRFAVYAGPVSFPDYYYTTRPGFTGVNSQPVPGFFFIDENLVPDQAANARLGGIFSIDWAELNPDGSLQVSTWDASIGRMEQSSFALLPDGSRDPRHPTYVPVPSGRTDKVWTFVDQDGKPIAAANFIHENSTSLWSLSPFAHFHRNTNPGLISLEPFEQSVAAGQRAGMILVADNPFTDTCQWFHNGNLIPGETNQYLSIPNATVSDAGEYRVEFTRPGATEPLVRLAHLTVTPPDTGLLNISARATVSPSSPLILGLSLQSKSSHKLLARTVGRGLADYGAPAPLLGDSKLSLYGPSGLLQSKAGGIADSEIASLAAQVGAFTVKSSTDSPGSALAPTLDTGVYSLISETTDASTGTTLSEVYLTDASDLPTGSLRNLSARGHVDAGGNPFIVGLVVKGTTPLRILLRAIGPELASFGIKDALADPVMEFHSDHTSTTFTLTNDNWSGDADIAAAFRQVGAFDIPTASKDSALVLTLDPGVYTVLIRDAKSTAGTVLVEAYVLN